MGEDTCATVTGLATVGIPVVDQDRAVRFYIETLGFEVRRDISMGDGARWVEVAPPGSGVSLALERAHRGHPSGVETGVRLTTDDAARAHEVLSACGVDADDVLRWPGVPPMFAFRDQDGNGLEIVEA
jgi:catechol 2,3-dioxygenase-like lactoylglutathione lyase family enzyme